MEGALLNLFPECLILVLCNTKILIDNTNILSSGLFRRDQIWFTQKDRFGATSLYSLSDYKVRSDAPFEKDYLSGKYGATPIIGNLESVLRRAE